MLKNPPIFLISLLSLLYILSTTLTATTNSISAKVTEDDKPVENISATVKSTSKEITTNANGTSRLFVPNPLETFCRFPLLTY